MTPPNHLILCCPLLLLPSVFPSIRVFSNELGLHIRWPKYCICHVQYYHRLWHILLKLKRKLKKVLFWSHFSYSLVSYIYDSPQNNMDIHIHQESEVVITKLWNDDLQPHCTVFKKGHLESIHQLCSLSSDPERSKGHSLLILGKRCMLLVTPFLHPVFLFSNTLLLSRSTHLVIISGSSEIFEHMIKLLHNCSHLTC